MRHRAVVLGVAFAFCASTAWPQSLTCSFSPQTPATIPLTSGQIALEDEDHNSLYVYDLGTKTTYLVPLTGLSNAENPVFTPDGSAILFSAENATEYDLYYWKVGTTSLVNLTQSSSRKNQDVKFSPDGSMIVWKNQSPSTPNVGGIAIANISLSGGTPTLSNVTQLLNGLTADGPTVEQSAPVFSPDQKYIYYFTNNGSMELPGQIWRYDFASGTAGPAFPQATSEPTYYYYYPAYPDLYNLMYVGGPISTGIDKIFVRAKLPGPGTIWGATDCLSNNSDPAPVSQDYFIYSRDNKQNDGSQQNSQFDLYLGQLSTGFVWFLLKPSDLNISEFNSSLAGSNYTSIPASGGSQARLR